MQRAFLGDALDHWKGSLIRGLQQHETLVDFAVDPLISDPDPWSPDDFLVFARLLQVAAGQFIPHPVGLSSRRAYFSEIVHVGDLFLDPDTGVATGSVRAPSKYIFVDEVRDLLLTNPSRLLMIYQHGDRTPMRTRVNAVIRRLEREYSSIRWCAYLSASVGMLFLSGEMQRIRAVVAHFQDLLHDLARDRVLVQGNQEAEPGCATDDR